MKDTLTKVVLYGKLAEKYGEEHYFKIYNVRDAVNALETNHPGFKRDIIELGEEGYVYKVTTPSYPDGLLEEDLDTTGFTSELHIYPTLQASGAFGRVLLGVALVAAAVAIPFGAVGGGMSLGLLGGSLILGGINQWLTPRPKSPKDSPKSTSFNQTTGVADDNACLPLCLGELRVTSGIPVLSSSLDTVRI
jgi:predicted phage tail protein